MPALRGPMDWQTLGLLCTAVVALLSASAASAAAAGAASTSTSAAGAASTSTDATSTSAAGAASTSTDAAGAASVGWTMELADARDLDTGRLLYREQHWVLRDSRAAPVERLVLYRCPDGNPFARKHLDYRGSVIAPSFDLLDARSGYREGLRRTPTPRLFVRTSQGAPERSAASPGNSLVADAGFDEFVRRQWAALAGGRSANIDFALPARLRSYRFTLARRGQERIAGEEALLLRLRVDGMLGWIAPHIDVAYGLHSRRLLRFEGPTNLRNPSGQDNWKARIEFGEPARPSSAAARDAADALTLSSCRA